MSARSALSEIFSEDQQEAFLRPIDAAWQAASEENWRRAHKQHIDALEELEELRAQRTTLTEEQLFRLANLEETLNSPEAALAVYRSITEKFPELARAFFHVGRLTFGTDSAAAANEFLKGLERDLELMQHTQPYLQYFYDREPDAAGSEAYSDLLAQYEQLRQQANTERQSVSLEDDLVSHELTAEQLSGVHECLTQFPEIGQAYIAEKPVAHFQNSRLYLLGFRLNRFQENVWTEDKKWLNQVLTEIGQTCPELNQPFGVILEKRTPWVARFESLDRSLIYERHVSRGRRIWFWIRKGFWTLWFLMVIGVAIYAIFWLI